MSLPEAPPVRIFLRNKFQLKSGGGPVFVGAVTEQLAFARTADIELFAACSDWPTDLSKADPEPPPPQMHIWQMPAWRTLYDAMYASAESSWLSRHQSVVAKEQQDLLIELRLGVGTAPPVLDKSSRVYLYQELRLTTPHIPLVLQMAVLKASRFLETQQVRWLWCATQVTAQPQELCLLWSAANVAVLDDAWAKLRIRPEYALLQSYTASLEQRYMYSTLVEGL